MILPIFIYGHPVLRKVTKEIDKDYPGLEKFIADFWQTMYFADGVGLAAPQVGRAIRMFCVDCSTFAEEEPELEGFKKLFINPKITSFAGDEWSMNEGCLSIPGINEDVTRKEEITIEYYDENWVFHTEVYDGYAARVIQHEYDHLESVLFTDYCSPIRRRLLKGKLAAISNGKLNVKYKVTLPR